MVDTQKGQRREIWYRSDWYAIPNLMRPILLFLAKMVRSYKQKISIFIYLLTSTWHCAETTRALRSFGQNPLNKKN